MVASLWSGSWFVSQLPLNQIEATAPNVRKIRYVIVVSRYFEHISLCFCDWQSATEIVQSAALCELAAMRFFSNQPKVRAISNVARQIEDVGFANLRRLILGGTFR